MRTTGKKIVKYVFFFVFISFLANVMVFVFILNNLKGENKSQQAMEKEMETMEKISKVQQELRESMKIEVPFDVLSVSTKEPTRVDFAKENETLLVIEIELFNKSTQTFSYKPTHFSLIAENGERRSPTLSSHTMENQLRVGQLSSKQSVKGILSFFIPKETGKEYTLSFSGMQFKETSQKITF